MPTLDQIEKYKQALAGAKHVLLIAMTKMGKSRWVAEAARHGYEILYIDKDNGFETLTGQGEGQPNFSPEVLKRIHYINPESMIDFAEALLMQPIIHYNTRQRSLNQSGTAKPDDEIVEIWPARIPRHVIVSFDTITSLGWDALKWSSAAAGVNLSDIDKYPREIYGKAGFRVTEVMKMIQVAHFHVVGQAHAAVYEKKEKPEGKVGEIKERDMIIVGTIDVPMSTSAAHGESIGKYFNQIAWIEMNGANRRVISFKTVKNRISGGVPETAGDPLTDHSFVSRFGKPPAVDPNAKPWIRYLTVESLAAEKKALAEARAAAAPRLGNSGVVKPPASVNQNK